MAKQMVWKFGSKLVRRIDFEGACSLQIVDGRMMVLDCLSVSGRERKALALKRWTRAWVAKFVNRWAIESAKVQL